ncbi:MAG TPA: hypothetical protein PLF91_06925, partial [Mycolicibacterium fallax]|nr:hypothetical protein [Mycolicibacterium fallax]
PAATAAPVELHLAHRQQQFELLSQQLRPLRFLGVVIGVALGRFRHHGALVELLLQQLIVTRDLQPA